MARKTYWTPRAKEELSLVISYLAENWSAKEIDSFIADVENTERLISESPFIGRKVEKRNFERY